MNRRLNIKIATVLGLVVLLLVPLGMIRGLVDERACAHFGDHPRRTHPLAADDRPRRPCAADLNKRLFHEPNLFFNSRMCTR